MLPERINGNAKKYCLPLDLGMQHVLCQCHLNIFTGPFRPPHKKNPGGATPEIVGREPRNSPPFSHISHSVKRNTEGELPCPIVQQFKKWECELQYCPSSQHISQSYAVWRRPASSRLHEIRSGKQEVILPNFLNP